MRVSIRRNKKSYQIYWTEYLHDKDTVHRARNTKNRNTPNKNTLLGIQKKGIHR